MYPHNSGRKALPYGRRMFTLQAQSPYRQARKGVKARIRKSGAPPKNNNFNGNTFDKAGTAGSGDRPGCLRRPPRGKTETSQ